MRQFLIKSTIPALRPHSAALGTQRDSRTMLAAVPNRKRPGVWINPGRMNAQIMELSFEIPMVAYCSITRMNLKTILSTKTPHKSAHSTVRFVRVPRTSELVMTQPWLRLGGVVNRDRTGKNLHCEGNVPHFAWVNNDRCTLADGRLPKSVLV